MFDATLSAEATNKEAIRLMAVASGKWDNNEAELNEARLFFKKNIAVMTFETREAARWISLFPPAMTRQCWAKLEKMFPTAEGY